MINLKDIKRITKEEIGNFLQPLGYSRSKAGFDQVATFQKKDENYYYTFYCHTNKYNEYQLVYGFDFGINKIVQLQKEIDSHIPLKRGVYNIKDSITGMSPGQLLDPLHPARAYRYFSTEEELLSILAEIKTFYQETFIPFCNKYSDFQELDRLINSPEDFWEDCVGKSIPFSFFHVTRLIIARLANNPDFDEIVEKNHQVLGNIWEKFGGVYERSDPSHPEVFAATYLKNKLADL